MLRITRLGVGRTATTLAIVLGGAYGVATLGFSAFVVLLPGPTPIAPGAGHVGVVTAVVISALVAALVAMVVGWIGVAIGCALYNSVAARVGGIELAIDQPAPPRPPDWGMSPPR